MTLGAVRVLAEMISPAIARVSASGVAPSRSVDL
jgi:hypothetical protein